MFFISSLKKQFTAWGKRKTPEQEQEESPAKRTRTEPAGMQDTQQHLAPKPGTQRHGRHRAEVVNTALPEQLALRPQQQLQLPDPAACSPAEAEPCQAPARQQQQEPGDINPSLAGYQQVLQKLDRPPAGTTAAAQHHRAAAQQARPVKHMPLPQQPVASHGQDPFSLRGDTAQQQQQQQRALPFHRMLSSSSSQHGSPPTWHLTPATAGRGRMQQQGYGAYGPPPHHFMQHDPHAAGPSTAPTAAGAVRAAQLAGVARRAAPPHGLNAAAAAGAQHRALMPAAAAGAGGSARPGVQGVSAPLQEVRQRLSYGGTAQYDAGAHAAADAFTDAAAAAGVAGNSRAAAATAALPNRGGFAGGTATPPPSFAAALGQAAADLGMQSELDGGAGSGLGMMHSVLDKREAAAVRRVAESAARRKKLQQAAERQRHSVGLLTSDITKLLSNKPDHEPHRTDGAAQAALEQLMHEDVERQQQRLQHEAQLQRERQQQRLRHEQLLAAAVTPIKPAAPVQPLQQQQQQQHVDEDDDDDFIEVLEVSSDGAEATRRSEQWHQQHQVDGLPLVSDEEEESEGSEDEEEEEESSEAAEAAEGIHTLGISTWMGRRADWRATPEQVVRFNQATSGEGQEVLTSHEGSAVELTRSDLATMRPGEWLNDECMNMYMALLQDHDTAQRANGGLACHFFTTFFLNKLYRDAGEYKYANVRRWTLPARLKSSGQASDCVLKCDRLLFPVHRGSHWTALMVDIKQQRLVYFDSLLGRHADAVAAVRRWVADEAKDKLKVTWDTSTWEEVYPSDIPRQENGYDCGVFALMFCNRMSLRGDSFDFLQADISVNIRVAITCDLLDTTIKATGVRD